MTGKLKRAQVVRVEARNGRMVYVLKGLGANHAFRQLFEEREVFAAERRSLETAVRQLRTQVARQERLLTTLLQARPAPGGDRAAEALRDMQQRLGLDPDPVKATDASAALEARSAAARQRWIDEGLLVGSTELKNAWHRSRQALEQAVERGELFSLKINGRRWYPARFTQIDPEQVKAVCSLMKNIDPESQFIFWMRPQGNLGGRTIADALKNGDVQAALRATEAFAREQSTNAQAA